MYAIVDIETTGLNPVHDRIIEIAILVYNDGQVAESFSTLLNPEMRLPPGITRISGITNEMLQDAPKFYQIARRVVELTENRILVAHNARFDYAFLRQAFRALGYHFHRRLLCTLRLSRKLLPGLSNYTLPFLCHHLQIPLVNGHRAPGDAGATLQLFQALQSRGKEANFAEPIAREARETFLPPGIGPEQVAALPEAAGVYFFYDGEGRLIYVGKSTNIRRRVLDHFSGDLTSQMARKMKERIAGIAYEVTGSELIALLLESDIIKTCKPAFNRDQRNTIYLYGIYSFSDKNGYVNLRLEPLQTGKRALLSFTNRPEGEEFLLKLMSRYQLCQKLCHFHKTGGACFHYHLKLCRGACIGLEPAEIYNRRVGQALGQFDYTYANFLIIGAGRREEERSVVDVEKGVYRGFGFFEPALAGDDIAALKSAVQFREDNQDVRRIIRRYLKSHPGERIVRY